VNRRNFVLSTALTAMHAQSHALLHWTGEQAKTEAESVRQQIMNDSLRPRYHLMPQAGFVGDPCAPRFFGGKYHVFFHGSYGGRGWQHAVSSDLIHWKHMPIALIPTENGYDSYGTFTGGVMPGGEGASIVYTGVTKVAREQETIRAEGLRETQCIATSTDLDLREFKKLPTPVIMGPPPGMQVTGFRDPFGWKSGDTWYMGVGSGFPQVGGAILLYRSKDMLHWEYVHPLAQGVWNGQSFSNPVPSGEMWECPDFFPLGDRHVLIYSTEHATFWEVGTFDESELRFHSDCKGILDHGAYYAPRSMADGNGRRILWGWLQETRPHAEATQAGWSGCISLPRVLTLSDDRKLQIEVPPELEVLRLSKVSTDNPLPMSPDGAFNLGTIRERSGEIICKFRASADPCNLELQAQGPSGTQSLLKVAFSYANGKPMAAIGDRLLPLSPASDLVSTVHIWLDGSVVETFLDKRQAMTTRCYEPAGHAGEVQVTWSGASGQLKDYAIFQLQPISSDRLTT
jgi:beta-fructofuranosidase